MPPKKEGICDKCGSPVVQREDETEAAISHRLDTYNKKTAPLIGFYEKEGMLITVSATSSEAVIAAIKKKLAA
jgi:adenylate kinase